ncbi:MAG: TatD family hydrolase [Bacteroidaceae bacterium]|nr:TatD family hydrolase [Bacteroidaceae bacterium]
MIDTHAHIDGPEFADDLETVLLRAKEAGVEKIFVPGICLKDTPHLLNVCQAHPNYLYPMIGLHPENIMDEDSHQALDQLERMIDESVIAIGEVGLDFYWDATYKQEQIEVFEHQMQWAEKYNLPLMIHSRNAHQELMEVMERHRASNLSGVFHCFTGTEEEARELLTFPNFMLGIGGVLTFKKSTLREVVKNAVPLSRIVLETDSPYMAPVPNRGKRNESAYVRCVAEKLAEIYDTDFDNIVLQTTKNTLKVFKKVTFFDKK